MNRYRDRERRVGSDRTTPRRELSQKLNRLGGRRVVVGKLE